MFGFEVANRFEEANHLRMAEKCCSNCKFGEDDYEGAAECNHPSLDYIDDDTGEKEHADLGTYQCNVCDLWAPKPGKETAP